MNIENLKVGMTIKNYKELCNVLSVDPKVSNNSRKAHHKQFEQYFEYEKQGQKYIITKIHSDIKKKVDNRGGNNKVYQEDFEKLMINTIYKNINKVEMLLSKGQIFKVMELCNDNYTLARQNIPRLSELLNLSEKTIYDFYDNNNIKLTNIVERNLKAMRRKSMLMYESVVCICIKEGIVLHNELGLPIAQKHGNGARGYFNEIHREATKEEKALILKYENMVKAELGAKDNKEVFLMGKWKEYKQRVENLLDINGTNIIYYYDSYKITWFDEIIEQEYKKIDWNNIDSSRNDINNNVIKSIEKSTKTRHTKAKNKSTKFEVDELRSKDSYVEEQLTITNVIIKRNAKDIKSKLKEKPIKLKKVDKLKEDNNPDVVDIDFEQLELDLKWDLQALDNDVPF